MPEETLRIIDANLNRIGEGLRVLEDIARLLLDDAALSQQLKDMRHELVKVDISFEEIFLQARNSEGDVGIDLQATGEEKYKEITATVVANARRVQEALRVMEEMAKNPAVPLDSDKFKRARFKLYTIEKELFAKLIHREV
ncbi:MAG TPA: thiamine-phosphate pyrophosphorylase [Dehalococcoidia bacterium]|nr:thiamine-phosphate pyrophosphorylase [Dehalococcoidia bacterium]